MRDLRHMFVLVLIRISIRFDVRLVRGLSVSVRGRTGHFLLYTDIVKCWCVCERVQVNSINWIYFLLFFPFC